MGRDGRMNDIELRNMQYEAALKYLARGDGTIKIDWRSVKMWFKHFNFKE
jgi:hypothetical protein